MPDVAVPLLSLGVGALLGGLSQALVARYASFKESKGIAKALDAEITAILRVVEQRRYVPDLEAIITRLENPNHQPTVEDVFAIPVTQNYFQVFDSLCPKINLLGDLSVRVISCYTLAKSLLEDLYELRQTRELVVGDRQRTLVKEGLLSETREALTLLQMAQQEAHTTLEHLREYQHRRWFRVFS